MNGFLVLLVENNCLTTSRAAKEGERLAKVSRHLYFKQPPREGLDSPVKQCGSGAILTNCHW